MKNYNSARKLNMAAGIIDIIFGCVFSVIYLYALFVVNLLIDLFSLGSDSATVDDIKSIVILIVGLCLAACVVVLIFGSITVAFRKHEKLDYCKKRGTFLAFAIVESVFVGYAVYNVTTGFNALWLITAIILITSITFRYIAYEKLKGCKEELEKEEKQEVVEELIEKEKGPKEIDIDKLQKLVDLKNAGAISEEEFEMLKKKELGL